MFGWTATLAWRANSFKLLQISARTLLVLGHALDSVVDWVAGRRGGIKSAINLAVRA